MEHHYLQTIILALVLGTVSFVLAKRLKVPAILFYLLLGVLGGPMVFDVIRSKELGSGMPTLVELSVAIILFEGGLSLPAGGFRAAPGGIRRILLVALPLSGLGAILLAHWVLGLSWRTSAVFGAIIVVTGPSVIGPLLRAMRLPHRLEILMRYEAIWGDCIGVLLSAVALELMTLHDISSLQGLLGSFASRLVVGVLIGAGGAFLIGKLVLPWVARLGDPSLPGMVALAAALAVFWQANSLVGSSGPVAAAVAGFTLSAMNTDCLHEIRHFKDQIAMVLIAMLFVLLSASIDLGQQLAQLPAMVAVAALLLFVVRPLAMLLALSGKTLRVPLRERLYLGLVGPRGIIAIAVASYVTLLVKGRAAEMEALLTLIFVVIFLTGSFATVFGRVLARVLGLSITDYESGIVIVGANQLSQGLAEMLRDRVPIKFVETDPYVCGRMEEADFDTICSTGLEDDIYGDAEEEGFRRVLIMTKNDALNALILRHAQSHSGPNRSFRTQANREEMLHQSGALSRRFLAFHEQLFLSEVLDRMERGESWLEILSPEEAVRRRAVALVELLPKGVKIVRAGGRPENSAICLVRNRAGDRSGLNRIPSPYGEAATDSAAGRGPSGEPAVVDASFG